MRLIAADPHAGAAAYAQLADTLLRAGNSEGAYKAMQDCLARDPYNFQTHLNLGSLSAHAEKVGRGALASGVRETLFPGQRCGNLHSSL